MLQGSDKRKDYDGFKPMSLIYVKGQHHIAIAGKGIIDGQGRALMKDVFKRLEEGALTDPEWKTKGPLKEAAVVLFILKNVPM